MRWGLQKFLNPATHPDKGWVKFNIETNYNPKTIDLTAGASFGDCYRNIDMDFSVFPISADKDGVFKASRVKGARSELAARKKKVAALRSSVNAFCDKMEDELEGYEYELTLLLQSKDTK